MPAVSKKQQQLFAIAEHEPGKLHKKNRGLLRLGKRKLHEFAATRTKGLPERLTELKKEGRFKKKR
jgi:hypothetical protein